MKVKLIYAFLCIIIACSSFFIGRQSLPQNEDSGYPLLAKRLFVENPSDTIINFSPLRDQIRNYVRSQSIEGSIYFEYLPTGTSIRIEGDSELIAASLMKMPVIMDLYRAYELGRVDIDSTVPLQKEWLDNRFGSLYQKGEGYRISLREAAKLALRDSDNTAYAAVLFTTNKLLALDENSIASLDVQFNRDGNREILISARSYTSFLKCLYFSCFNTQEHSNEMLSYLADTPFNERLKLAIPQSVPIAHKIGTFSDSIQSDCGIVYVPVRNYAVCVMLRSTSEQEGNTHISEISKMIYEYVTT